MHRFLNSKIPRRVVLATIFFFSLLSAEACSLKIPEQIYFQISPAKSCFFNIRNRTNYLALSYYKANGTSLSDLFNGGEEITESDGDFYVPYDVIDDANHQLTITSQTPLRKVNISPEIWKSTSIVHASALPKKQFKAAGSFSLTLKCIELVGGDLHQSFTTRYCRPMNHAADRDLDRYKALIQKIEIRP